MLRSAQIIAVTAIVFVVEQAAAAPRDGEQSPHVAEPGPIASSDICQRPDESAIMNCTDTGVPQPTLLALLGAGLVAVGAALSIYRQKRSQTAAEGESRVSS